MSVFAAVACAFSAGLNLAEGNYTWVALLAPLAVINALMAVAS